MSGGRNVAALADMNQLLGMYIGNALEVVMPGAYCAAKTAAR